MVSLWLKSFYATFVFNYYFISALFYFYQKFIPDLFLYNFNTFFFLALFIVFPFFKDPKLILHCTNHTVPRMLFISITCQFPGDKVCLLEVNVQVEWWRGRRLRRAKDWSFYCFITFGNSRLYGYLLFPLADEFFF